MKKFFKIVAGIVGAVIALGIIMSIISNNSKPTVTNTSKATSQPAKTADTTPKTDTNNLAIGQTVKSGNFEITVNSVRAWAGDQMDQPQKGKYIIIDATVKNVSNTVQSSSSIMMFNLVDQNGYKKDIAIMTNQKGSLDGTIQPNGMIRGEIAYDVEKDINTFAFQVQGNLSGDSQATYKLANLQ